MLTSMSPSAVPLSGMQVDVHALRGVAVNRGVDTVVAKELVGTVVALEDVVAVKSGDPIAAVVAVDPIVAIRCADATEPTHPDNIEVVGSIDEVELRHGPCFPSSQPQRTPAPRFSARIP